MKLQAIYDQMGNKVFNLALQYVQNREDAEEITQDVFITVHEKLEQFKGESTIETWIYRITVNKSLDFIKYKKRKKRWIDLIRFGDGQTDASDFNHPGVEMENKEALELLFSKINALKEQQKTVIILSRIENMSHAEIAEILQVSAKAVESLLARAKENLKKVL
jgi:RNA polymerase sigma-70 factor (ECF subfamily)